MKLPVRYDDIPRGEKWKVREEYIKLQKGACFHCGGQLTEKPPAVITGYWINPKQFPEGFLNYPVHLHHDHKTGLTLGAVHSLCNAVLWQYHGQ